MSVRCLTGAQKSTIIAWYAAKLFNQKQLAERFNTSQRTINRVLIEAGLATPVARIKGEAYQVMQVLKGYGMGVEQLKAALAAPALTTENVKRFLNACTPTQLQEVVPAALKPQPISVATVTEVLRRQTSEDRAQIFYNIELLAVAEKRKAYNAEQLARQSSIDLAPASQGCAHAGTPA